MNTIAIIGGGCISGDCNSIKGVNSCLYKKIGNGENCALDSGGNTDHQYPDTRISVKSDIF